VADSGISLAVVMKALRATKGLDVSGPTGALDLVTIADGEKIETISMSEPIQRKMLDYLGRRYKTPIHWFYNPLMIPGKEDDCKPS
jgi:hypothetical protein